MSVTKQSPSTTTVSGQRTTPFGAVENPELLNRLPNKVVLRVDTLVGLKEVWGDNILMARQHLYELVAGTIADTAYQDLIISYYKRYSAFANFVDEKYLFEEKDRPLVARIIEPARQEIKRYSDYAVAVCKLYGGQYLGSHQDYAFFAFPSEKLPELEGSTRLC